MTEYVPVAAVALLASTALVAFPIIYWVQDRRRRGLPLSVAGVTLLMFIWLKQ